MKRVQQLEDTCRALETDLDKARAMHREQCDRNRRVEEEKRRIVEQVRQLEGQLVDVEGGRTNLGGQIQELRATNRELQRKFFLGLIYW